MRKSCGVSEFEFPDLIPQYEREALKDLFDFEADEKQAQQEHCLKINTFEPYATKTILEALRAVERPIENQGYLFETKSDQLQRTSALMKTLSQKKVEDPESISDIQKQLSMDKVDNVHKTPVQLNDERPEVDLKHITIEENEQSLEFQPTQTHEDNEETSEPSVYAGQAASGIESSITQKEQEPKVMSTQLQMNPDHDDEEKTSQIHVDPHFDDAFISDSIAVRNSSQIEKLIVPKSDFNTSQPAFIEDSIPKYKQYSQKFPRSLPKNPISRQLESQDFDLFENEHLSKPYVDVVKQSSHNFELSEEQESQSRQADIQRQNKMYDSLQQLNQLGMSMLLNPKIKIKKTKKFSFKSIDRELVVYEDGQQTGIVNINDTQSIRFDDKNCTIVFTTNSQNIIEVPCFDQLDFVQKRQKLRDLQCRQRQKAEEIMISKSFKQIIIKSCDVVIKRINIPGSVIRISEDYQVLTIYRNNEFTYSYVVSAQVGKSMKSTLRECGAKFE
ncbi:Hypothetical_protein [Hexamita inflata]|uniref:Hypothetical_protein n=1 Tax=Hexamita inflata TaxID=28002 RepID=A0AA86P396_9EUKA|nr:Hypothetical protein HINF_LOCUS18561 [Hexamita inflata]